MADELEAQDSRRKELVANVSHELRTPIASMRMLAELLEEGRVEAAEQGEVFEALAREARRLGETVDRLLGFSRMAAGRYKVERRRGSIAAPITASIEAFEQRNPDGPRVQREIDNDIEGDIDAGQIQLAMDNLLANARKYAPDGAPYTATLRRRDGGAVISVKDRGPGVARRDQARIFRPFERAVPVRHYGGLGLGLFIVRTIVTRYGGTVHVAPRDSGGSGFVVRLPQGGA